jgi:pyruvate dehydrogenase E2 component (dihydrolipoamide acetyltransferase)
MPQLGETVTEGTVTRWFKSVGETVERDEPLFEVSTDKVDSEVPSPADGVLSQIVVQEGETVDVGTVLAVVSNEAGASTAPSDAAAETAPDSASESAAASTPQPAPSPPPVAAVAVPPVEQPAPPAPPAPPVPPAPPAPPAPPVAEPLRVSQPPAAANEPGWQSAGTVGEYATDATGRGPVAPDGLSGTSSNLVLSPVVRRLLDENGIDPSQVRGTGVGGRITRADVLDLIDTRRETAGGVIPEAPAQARPPTAPPSVAVRSGGVRAAPDVPSPLAGVARAGADEVVPFTNIRRRTAEHMVRSKATSAHTLVVLEADYELVERVRREHGARFKSEEGFSLTYLPFIARATVEALHQWPNLNSSVGDDALIVHHEVNLGIAVDLDHQGLIVPVVHRAEELTLRGMARRIRDVAERARTKKLSADDITGGTFSLTNAGPFGTLLTAPIINQPQVGILSTDGVKRRPVVVTQDDGSEAIAIHSVGLLCLSWDHRAVDGAYAAAFLARLVELLSSHDWSAEL